MPKMMVVIFVTVLIFLLGIVALVSYKPYQTIFLNDSSSKLQKIPIIEPSKDSFSKEESIQIPAQEKRLYEDVAFLTSLDPPRNSENIVSLERSVLFIEENFTLCGLETTIQAYQTPDENTYKNVIGTLHPEKKERIVIGAHYDVCDNQPGADDNASAVAGLLEIARLVIELKPNLNCRIDFVAFPLEEPPYFASPYMGSMIHAQALKEENATVRAMICLEMIGYFTDAPDSQDYPLPALKGLYPSIGNFISVVGRMGENELVGQIKKSMERGGKVPVYSINAPEAVTGIAFSDHRSYWHYGFPAVMITDTSFFRNPHYHQKTDTIDTLDFKRMTEVVKGVYQALVDLAQ